MRPQAPAGFSNCIRTKEMLVGAVGIEQNALAFLRDYKRIAQLKKNIPSFKNKAL